ncbi:CidA/LrgA family protein [Oceanispirochaeta sp. M1]|nr:CidA/LrgA family protein [Oceanispirochaeta sp. M1]
MIPHYNSEHMIKLSREIILIALLLAAGILIGKLIPFPSSLSSMILLLLLLITGVFKEEYFTGGISDLILKNLAFFFLPPAVKVIDSLGILEGVWVKLVLIMLISNVLVMGVTGMVVQLFLKTEKDHD